MEETLPEMNIQNTALLNSTWEVNSIYIDEHADTTLDQQLFYEHKISSLEGELRSLSRNEILLQSQFMKLVDSKDLQLSFDRNLREYHMVFHKGKTGESSPQRFHFDNMENGGLLISKIDAISSIVGMDHIHAFDMLNTSEGFTPRLLDDNKLLRPPHYCFNTRPVSPTSDNSQILQQPLLQASGSVYEGFQAEISRLEHQILQSNNKSNLQLLKVTQSNTVSVPMKQIDGQPNHTARWEGTLEFKKEVRDVCLQTDPASLLTEPRYSHQEGGVTIIQKIVQRVVQRVVEVPVETLLIVEQIVPIMSDDALEVDFDQFNPNKQSGQGEYQNEYVYENKEVQSNDPPSEFQHANEKTRELYDKVISQNDFLREQVITLIDQLEDYKRELEKNRSIISELEFKINSATNRDFYKVKLSDLERKISQKTLIYEELQRSVHLAQTQPEYSSRYSSSSQPDPEHQRHSESEQTSELVKHYQSTFIQMTEQIECLKTKIYQLREKESSRIEDESTKISRYIEEIEYREKEIEELAKANREYRSELQEQLEANGDLRNIVEKLWQETEELSSKLEEKPEPQPELQDLHEEESKLTQDKEDIDQMNHLVSSLTEQITIIKEELYQKQQREIQDRGILEEYCLRLRESDSEIEMQRLTIDQFKHACEKSQEYIMLLNQQIHHLKRLQEKSENVNTLQSIRSKDYLKSNKSLLNVKGGRFNGEDVNGQKSRESGVGGSAIDDFKYLLSLQGDNPSSARSSEQTSYLQSNRTEREIFLEHLENSQFSSGIIHRLISILKETNLDIQTIESQNQYLKNLTLQYEKLLQNSSSPSNPHLSEEQIVNVLLQNQRLQKQLSQAQSSNIDINFFEQIVNELEKTKLMNRTLSQEIEKCKAELLNSEGEIFEKTEAINYLNLALIKISAEKVEVGHSEGESIRVQQIRLENNELRQELQSTLEINRTLEASIQKLSQIKNHQIHSLNAEITTLQSIIIPNLNRQIKHLELELATANRERVIQQGEIKQLYRDNKEHHSKSAINMIDKYYIGGDSQQLQSKRMGKTNRSLKRFNPVQKSLEEMKGVSISLSTTLYIMYRLAEYVQEKLTQGNWKLLTPKSIMLLNFSEQTPELIQIMALSVDRKELDEFLPPQVLEGKEVTPASMSWNVGVLLDYLVHGSVFFESRDDILSAEKQDEYVLRRGNMGVVSGIIEGLLAKPVSERMSVQRALETLRQQVFKRRM